MLEIQSSIRHATSPTPPATPSLRVGRGPRMEDITSRTGARHFEVFLQSIKKCDSLLDVRRLKNDVTGEIRRTRIVLGM